MLRTRRFKIQEREKSKNEMKNIMVLQARLEHRRIVVDRDLIRRDGYRRIRVVDGYRQIVVDCCVLIVPSVRIS
jgi:hypothetical protein